MFSVQTTAGIIDASGEEIELFSVGDFFTIAAHAREYYPYATGTLTVLGICIDETDHNDYIVRFTNNRGMVASAHRMDIEHATR